MQKTLPVILALFLLCTFTAYADGISYPMTGNNMKYSSSFGLPATVNYNVINIPGAAATFNEPIAFDANNDGISELFIPGTGGIIVSPGDSPENPIGEFGGFQTITAVACDVDNDNDQDYVTVIEENGTSFLIAANYNGGGSFDVFATKQVTLTNQYGNMACGRFYNAQGNSDNFVMWVDNQKELYIMNAVGGSFSGNIINVSDAITEEANNPFARGSHRIVFSQTMDPRGNGVVIFFAGTKAYAYFSDGTSDFENIQPPTGVGGYNETFGNVKLYGPINASGQNVLVQWDGDLGTGTLDQPRAFYARLRLQNSGLGNYLVSPGAFSVPLTTPFAVADSINSPSALGRFNTETDTQDSLFIRMWDSNAVNGRASASAGTASNRIVRVSSLGTVLSSVTGPLIPANYGDDKSTGIMMADMDKDGLLDIILAFETGVLGTWDISYYKGSQNFSSTSRVSLANITFSSNDIFQLPMQAVDLNRDFIPDLIINPLANDDTYVVMSQGSPFGNAFTFTVEQRTTFKNISIQKITANFNQTANVPYAYQYAVTCDVSSTAYWNNLFLPGYNGTNYITSLPDPNGTISPSRISNNGLLLNIPGNVSSFFFKQFYIPVRDNSEVVLSFSSFDNLTYDLVAETSLTDLMLYYRIVKTGTNLSVYAVNTPDPDEYIGSTSVGSAVVVRLQLSPQVISGSNDLEVSVIVNNQTVGFDQTRLHNGWNQGNAGDVQNIQIFTDSNASSYLKSFGFFKIPSATGPQRLDFVNMVWYTLGNDLFVAQAQSYTNQSIANLRILGTEFNIIPGWITNQTEAGFAASQVLAYPILAVANFVDPFGIIFQTTGYTTFGGNNVFYSECTYDRPGAYVQRHYLTPGLSQDLTVVVSDRLTCEIGQPNVFDPESPGACLANGGDDGETGGTSGLATFLGLDGILSDTMVGFLLAGIIIIVLSGGAFLLHWIFGALTFITVMTFFVVLGWLPIWVGLILVIIAAGLVAVAFRNVFAGS